MTADIDPRVIRRLADMHAVYRMFGRAGELLYVGMTGHLRRFDDHAVKRWFPAVSRITLEWHETEASARVSERRAIQAERPRYNIEGTPKRPRRAIPADMPPPAETNRDVLADVLRVFGDAYSLQWATLAERLADQFPGRWADVTKDAVSAQCRSLGVPSVCVRKPGRRSGAVQKGCRRDDVEKASVRRLTVVASRD